LYFSGPASWAFALWGLCHWTSAPAPSSQAFTFD
jgi:hypothetical protein